MAVISRISNSALGCSRMFVVPLDLQLEVLGVSQIENTLQVQS
jgi:hypothetical protein